ncbi:tRNA-guanine transglycosylase family protein [Pochonia chlamydosporia 170]|uniref:Queuine tRNA-ribosyltransferase accessory subunit 2 n=1 Tax=Pochonia chlamydosporia 170 TaxID=1380566 RepID=A0A179FDY4_METCM|nr:tRNA-guanine transglycosylase family protein [Pochonia chlamydosporia 170]OAQ63451.1 tRNA-guanine transglycosylase family protein [Pochonia chlamydosporia 170]
MSETHHIDSDMPARKVFELLGAVVADGCAARLGRLSIPGRKTIDTPNYTAVTSRGAIPHLTPDNVTRHTNLGAAYMALEDFVERKEPPIYNTPEHNTLRRLHNFTALSPDRTTILGARRCPAVVTPMGNGAKAVTLFTSTGFASVNVSQYVAAVTSLQPDIVVPLADSLHTSTTPASKKLIKMVERTEEWVDDFLRQFESRKHLDELGISVFAPVLPVELPIQWDYLRHLAEDITDDLSGLAVYDVNILPELKPYKPLAGLPKISFDQPRSPHEVLRQISLGVDICAVPFVNSVSDAGVALTFSFPAPEFQTPEPMGINMWSEEHSVAVVPLQEGCECYACTHHHRAYLRHLLNAKEMLGWNLLQIHNHHVIDVFFQGIRAELKKGLDNFEEQRKKFLAAYEPELPEGTGERPRARGYHFKSEAGQEKMNKSTWIDMDRKPNGQAVESMEVESI